MLKKIIEKLKNPHVWYFVGIALVVAAGVILASTLYRSNEDRPPDINGGQGEPVVTLGPDMTRPWDETESLPFEDQWDLTDPTISEPEASDPVTSEPEGMDPVETAPDATEPTATQPDATEPTVTQPDATEPTVTQPDVTEPTATEPTKPIDPEKPNQTDNPGIPPESEIPQITYPKKEELTVKRVAAFSGAYVEDGSDEPVQNVAAILVTNESNNFLDMATLVYDIDGKEARFIVTGLPAGASAWVMEASRITVTNDSKFTQKGCETAFRQNAITVIENTTIQSSGNMLKLENNSDETLRNVAIYYKVVHTDGNYFGGITYMAVIGDVAPGESAEKFAGHFKEGWANVVRVGYQTDEPSG